MQNVAFSDFFVTSVLPLEKAGRCLFVSQGEYTFHVVYKSKLDPKA